MKISIIHPSYGRPEKFWRTYDSWINSASDQENVEYIPCLEVSESELYLHANKGYCVSAKRTYKSLSTRRGCCDGTRDSCLGF